jgi:SOS-response transcriptional repressor LexA
MMYPIPAETSQVSSPALSRCAAVGWLDAIATTTAKAPMTWRNIQPSSFFALDSLLPDQPNSHWQL